VKQKKETAENVVLHIKENFPETEHEFQKVLNTMYMTFCKKQFDYGPGNIAMGTQLRTEEEVNMSLLGIIVRMNQRNIASRLKTSQ